MLSLLDLAVVAAYMLLLIWLGHSARRKGGGGDPEQFLLAGRGLSLPLFVGSLVSTWYGGILGVTEIAFTDGISAWLTQGGFWYLAYVLFAVFLAGRLAESGATTLPDEIGRLHGGTARAIAALLNLINVIPISYVLALGVLSHLLLGVPAWIGVIGGTLIAVAYSELGGFRAVVYTDMLQFVIMCFAVALLLIIAVASQGGAAYLMQKLPATHLAVTGKLSGQELAVWAMIALSTLVDPNFYHRCHAAGSAKRARAGVFMAIGFWLLFDVCTVFGGLYARAALPEADPRAAYPMFALALLPVGLKGAFVVGILATVMSTIDSYCFIGGMTIGHDLLKLGLKPALTDEELVRWTRRGVAITALLAVLLAVSYSGSFKAVWKFVGSLSTASLLVPTLLGFAGWRRPGAGVAGMLAGAIGTVGMGLVNLTAKGGYFEPLLVGALLALVVQAMVHFAPFRAKS